MAKERQVEELSESEERRRRIIDERERAKGITERAQQEQKLEQSQREFTARKELLAEHAADMIQKKGRDYHMSQLLLSYLDIAIQMEETIETLTDVSLGVSCITDAMGCMDDILNLNRMSLESSLKEKHGFFARLREKRRMRNAIANNLNRLKRVSIMITGSQSMAYAITDVMKKVSIKTQKKIAKINAKRNMEIAKVGGGAPLPPSPGEQMVNGIISKRSGDDGAPATASGNVGGSAPVGGDGGLSDVSDLL